MTTLKSITTSFEIVKELLNAGKILKLRQRFNIFSWEWEYVFTHIIKP
jgi:hypothetical protein